MLSGIAYAATTESHGVGLSSAGSTTEKWGAKIHVGRYGLTISKISGNGATNRCQIIAADQTVLKTSTSYSGSDCLIAYNLSANTDYYVVQDKDGSAYEGTASGLTDPMLRTGTYLNWTGGLAIGGGWDNTSKYYRNVASVTVDLTLPSTPSGSSLNTADQVGETLTATGAGSSGATSYKYEFRCDSTSGTILKSKSSTASWVINNTCGKSHTVYVLIWGSNINGDSLSYETETKAIINAIPSAVSSFTNPTSASYSTKESAINVSWSSSTDGDGDSITYRTFRRLDAGAYSVMCNNATRYCRFAIPTDGNYTYKIEASDGTAAINSSVRWIFRDTVVPMLNASFTNLSKYYRSNIIGQFNFSDAELYRWNVTIDSGARLKKIAGAKNVAYTSYVYNLSYSSTNLESGQHILNIEVADGHTAKEIAEYEIKKPFLSSHYVEYETEGNKIKVSQKEGSNWDKFETKKEKDRYTFDFIPSDKKKSSYTFKIETEEPMEIVKRPESEVKEWLVSGNNWIDFYMPKDKGVEVSYNLIKPTIAEVTVSGISNSNKLEFSSVGDLNIVSVNYTIYVLNSTTSYSSPIYESTSSNVILSINTTGTDYVASNFSAVLYYNGISYTPTKSNTATSVDFTKQVTSPSTNVVLTNQFYINLSISGVVTKLMYNQTVNPYAYNITLFREETNTTLNLTETTGVNYTVTLNVHCPTTVLSNILVEGNNTLYDVDCNYEYWTITLESTTDSYFRTIKPARTGGDIRIYMLDLKVDDAIQQIYTLNDLANNYQDGYIIVYTYINNSYTEVIKQKFDIENKVTLWLDKSRLYYIYAEDDSGVSSLLGNLYADAASSKTLIIPSIPLGTEYGYDDTWLDILGSKQSGSVAFSYYDRTLQGYKNITFKVYNMDTNAELFSYTDLNGFNATYTALGLNRSMNYMISVYIDHWDNTHDKYYKQPLWYGDKSIIEGFEDYTDHIHLWVAAGTVVILMMVASIVSAPWIAMISVIMGMVFLAFGWFSMIATRTSVFGFSALWGFFIFMAIIIAFELMGKGQENG